MDGPVVLTQGRPVVPCVGMSESSDGLTSYESLGGVLRHRPPQRAPLLSLQAGPDPSRPGSLTAIVTLMPDRQPAPFALSIFGSWVIGT
jgi:hypothetical protein